MKRIVAGIGNARGAIATFEAVFQMLGRGEKIVDVSGAPDVLLDLLDRQMFHLL